MRLIFKIVFCFLSVWQIYLCAMDDWSRSRIKEVNKIRDVMSFSLKNKNNNIARLCRFKNFREFEGSLAKAGERFFNKSMKFLNIKKNQYKKLRFFFEDIWMYEFCRGYKIEQKKGYVKMDNGKSFYCPFIPVKHKSIKQKAMEKDVRLEFSSDYLKKNPIIILFFQYGACKNLIKFRNSFYRWISRYYLEDDERSRKMINTFYINHIGKIYKKNRLFFVNFNLSDLLFLEHFALECKIGKKQIRLKYKIKDFEKDSVIAIDERQKLSLMIESYLEGKFLSDLVWRDFARRIKWKNDIKKRIKALKINIKELYIMAKKYKEKSKLIFLHLSEMRKIMESLYIKLDQDKEYDVL